LSLLILELSYLERTTGYMQTALLAIARPSVCLSTRYMGESLQNGMRFSGRVVAPSL